MICQRIGDTKHSAFEQEGGFIAVHLGNFYGRLFLVDEGKGILFIIIRGIDTDSAIYRRRRVYIL